jgi:hypothetical protein
MGANWCQLTKVGASSFGNLTPFPSTGAKAARVGCEDSNFFWVSAPSSSNWPVKCKGHLSPPTPCPGDCLQSLQALLILLNNKGIWTPSLSGCPPTKLSISVQWSSSSLRQESSTWRHEVKRESTWPDETMTMKQNETTKPRTDCCVMSVHTKSD